MARLNFKNRLMASALVLSQVAVSVGACSGAFAEEGRERPGRPGAGDGQRPDRPGSGGGQSPDPRPGNGGGQNPDPRPGNGGGQNPDPRPGNGGGQNPDPKPQVPVGPSAGEIASARSDGLSDGNPDGGREGRDRGWQEGVESGRNEGYREGYDRCLNDRKRQVYDQGYAEGMRTGSNEGNARGQVVGFSEGQNAGYSEGRADGDRRARAAARRDAEAPAREQGRREADATDSYDQGSRAGSVAGDARARETATRVDYPKGREAYRAQRLAESVSRVVEENLSGSKSASFQSKNTMAMAATFLDGRFSMSGGSGPDYRYAHERRTYPYSEQNQAYSSGYREGYRNGFESVYRSEFRRGHESGEAQGREQGCRESQRVDVRRDYERGRDEGYARGYREAYDSSYRVAYRLGYDPAFASASEAEYRSRYSGYYSAAYEEFRADAYSRRVNQLYQAGYAQAEQATFDRTYSGYAQAEFNRGVQAETADFQANPIRWMDSGFREEFEDSVIEPGETVKFWFYVRNFADQELSARDLRLEVETTGAGLSAIRRQELPASQMPGRGALQLSGALPVLASDVALGKTVTATVKVFWKGNLLGTKSYSFKIQNRASIEFASAPRIREGLESEVTVKIQNRSNQPITGPVRLELLSDSKVIELTKATTEVGTLAPGEVREASFTVIGRTALDSETIPLAIVASDGTRKRVAMKDFSGSVPVINDYRVTLTQSLDSLKAAGVSRLTYQLRNVSSRLVFGALELQARVLDRSGTEVKEARWIGFNPQFLLPLERGEQVKFVIPVVLTQGLAGGTVELEIRENGTPVVIHRAQF